LLLIEHTAFQERSINALDYSRFAFDPLDVGYGQLVHPGRIHSYPARAGGGCSVDPADPRPKPRALNREAASVCEEVVEQKLIPEEIVMNEDQVKGKVKDVAGRVERQAGEWTGDPEKQVQGALKQAEGKLQNAWGNAQEDGKKAVEKAPKTNEPVDDFTETADDVPALRR
jgi:uncharacterized protein YjbJ (UPF0337 family)